MGKVSLAEALASELDLILTDADIHDPIKQERAKSRILKLVAGEMIKTLDGDQAIKLLDQITKL